MFNLKRFAQNTFYAAIVASIASTPVFAQSISSDTLTKLLGRGNTGPMVKALAEQNALTFAPTQRIPAAFDFPAADVIVAFDGETHILTNAGMETLRSVAEALQHDRLQGQRFQVAAHMEPTGAQTTADRTSFLRAKIVVEHLEAFYGIQPGRLIPVGYGISKPVDPSKGQVLQNNRIELINILDL